MAISVPYLETETEATRKERACASLVLLLTCIQKCAHDLTAIVCTHTDHGLRSQMCWVLFSAQVGVGACIPENHTRRRTRLCLPACKPFLCVELLAKGLDVLCMKHAVVPVVVRNGTGRQGTTGIAYIHTPGSFLFPGSTTEVWVAWPNQT